MKLPTAETYILIFFSSDRNKDLLCRYNDYKRSIGLKKNFRLLNNIYRITRKLLKIANTFSACHKNRLGGHTDKHGIFGVPIARKRTIIENR